MNNSRALLLVGSPRAEKSTSASLGHYLISKLEADETIDSMDPPPIRIDYKTFIDDPPDINKLANSMVIFDDYDVIQGKEGDAVHTLIDDIATMGRKHGEDQGCISMLCLTHALTNYKKTRTG